MATNRRIEIDVVLNTEQVDQGFQEIEQGGKDLGKTFTGVGETFTGVSGAITSMGDNATQKLGAVGQTAQGAISSLVALGQSAQTAGTSFSALLGPIGLVGVAVFQVAKAWREYQDEINGVNIRHDAYIASVSELTSALEELATYQVKLNKAEVERLQNLSMTAKLDIESAQEIRERNAALDKRIFRLDIEIKQAKERLKTNKELLTSQKGSIASSRMIEQAALSLAQAQAEIEKKEQTRLYLSEKLKRKEQEAIELGQKGANNFAKFEAEKERLLKRSPKLRGEQLNAESKLLEDAALEQLKLREKTEQNLTNIAVIQSNRRIREIRAQETLSQEIRAKAIKSEEERLMLEIAQIQKDAQVKAQQEEAKRRAMAAAYRAKRLAEERQAEAEQAQIRNLEIDRLQIVGVEKEKILKLQYEQELKLAKDNDNKKIIAQLRYNNAITQLELDRRKKEKSDLEARQKAEQESRKRRLEEEKRLAQQRANFIFETQEFDAQQISNQTEREIKLLELRYEKELSLNKHTQEEITELQRRQTIERQKILDQSFNDSIDKLKSMGQDLSRSSIQAIYQSLVDAGDFDLQFEELKYNFEQNLGEAREEMMKAQTANDINLVRQKEEEITDITKEFEAERQKLRAQESQALPLMFGQILKGLGQEAAVEAMMETARGIATAFTMPSVSANHFAAAGVFASASAIAGIGGAALTNNANTAISRAGRGGGSTSPSGSPMTATTPQREQAETSQMVFNINFGGAVIYDTQRAAEQALADRITTLQNTRRRGAPRRGM